MIQGALDAAQREPSITAHTANPPSAGPARTRMAAPKNLAVPPAWAATTDCARRTATMPGRSRSRRCGHMRDERAAPRSTFGRRGISAPAGRPTTSTAPRRAVAAALRACRAFTPCSLRRVVALAVRRASLPTTASSNPPMRFRQRQCTPEHRPFGRHLRVAQGRQGSAAFSAARGAAERPVPPRRHPHAGHCAWRSSRRATGGGPSARLAS